MAERPSLRQVEEQLARFLHAAPFGPNPPLTSAEIASTAQAYDQQYGRYANPPHPGHYSPPVAPAPAVPTPDRGFRDYPIEPGLIQPGNIDIHHRPIVHNPDGSISTVRTITVGIGPGRFVNIPTVVNGQVVSNDQAIVHYRKTGQHLGVFASEPAALTAAQQLHEQQAHQYLPHAVAQLQATLRPVAKAASGKPLY